jgi:acyl carrier protein
MTGSEIDERLRTLIRDLARPVFKADPLADDMEILEGGLRLDSIAYAELLLGCEETFGIAFPDEWAMKTRLTVGELSAYVHTALS